MFYTTSLVRITSGVLVTGEVTHFLSLTSDKDRLFHTRLSNDALHEFLTEGTGKSDLVELIAIEAEIGDNVGCVQVNPDSVPEHIDTTKCPSCHAPLVNHKCVSFDCVGRRHNNFVHVSRLLWTRNTINSGVLIPAKFDYDPANLFTHEFDVSRPVERVTKELIDKVRTLPFMALLGILCELLELDDVDVHYLFEDVNSQASWETMLTSTEKVHYQHTLDKIREYVDSPLGKWITAIKIFTR